MRYINWATLVSISIVISLFFACSNGVEFTRVIEIFIRNDGTTETGVNLTYKEYVMVKNLPESNLERTKIMIDYYDSAGLSIEKLSEKPDIKHYSMSFYRPSIRTKKYFRGIYRASSGETKIHRYRVYKHEGSFGDRDFDRDYDKNKDYYGYLYVGRCSDDPAKWIVEFNRNLGTAKYPDERLEMENIYLVYECNKEINPDFTTVAEDSDVLAKYYAELKNRKSF